MRAIRFSEFGWKMCAIALVLVALSFVGLQITIYSNVGDPTAEFFWLVYFVSSFGALLAALLAILGLVAERLRTH